MERRASLVRAEWVLPVSSPPIHRGEVLVDGSGRIAGVAPRGALDVPVEIDVHDLGGSILLPGLVNAHAHPELAMFRGALEDLPFDQWILRLVAAKRAALTDEDHVEAARWSMVECLRAGITTVAATEASGAAAVAMSEAGIRGIVYQEVFGPDPAAVDASMDQLRADLDRILPLASDRVRIGVSPHAPYTISDGLYREVARFARAEAMPMAVHIAESAAERDLVARGGGDFAPALRARGIDTPVRAASPIQLLEKLGVLEERPLLIHCVDLDEADVDAIAGSGAPVVHCPVANARLGHGVAPILRLREAGVTVALGTDSVASNNRLDLLEEARVASLLQRARERRPNVLAAGDLLRLCTIDGARALGLDDRIGTLEVGKEADLCAVALGSPSTVPSFDPVVTLFHAARATDVVMTMVAGRVVYSAGDPLTPWQERSREAVERMAERLKEVL